MSLPATVLPVPLTAFVGRDRETAAVRQLLDEARLVTLTWAGGSGKTRLALAVARATQERGAMEIAWVELAALEEGAALPAHIAMALGAHTEGGGSTEHALTAVVQDRPLLLVLDNCEHLVEACAALVEHLLQRAPQLRILATSREALGVAGERSWLVPALSLPTGDGRDVVPDAAMAASAVQLFVQRARDVVPGFALTEANVGAVVQICRRLDGLPLALELAASRIAVLTPAQLATRLDDRFALLTSGSRSALPRHRTLRAAVDWSYDLLSEPERVLLERLAIFAGGFTLDAAETVCGGDGLDESAVLDLLAGLTTRSLVAMQEDDGIARYTLLETIREYAADKRTQRAAHDAVALRHARYYLGLARDAEPDLILGRAHRLRQMDVEHENLRVALAWSAAAGQGSSVGLPLAWALLWYWFHRQLWREGFAHFETALASAIDPPVPLRAAALHGLGLFGLYGGDPSSGARLEEADRLWQACELPTWRAFTLLVRTVEASLRRDIDAALGFAESAVAVARTTGNPWVVALTQAHALVPCRLWAQQWTAADALLGEAERVYRAHRYAIGVAYVLDAQAFTALQVGDPDRAVRLAQASLREEPTGQNRWLAGRSLRTLGAVLAARGALPQAVQLFGAAEAMYEAIGARALTQERLAVNRIPEELRGTLDADRFEAAWAAGRAMPFREAVACALAIDGSVGVDAPDGDESRIPPPVPMAGMVVPLEIRALGRLEILRDGVPVPAESWAYAKPRELLLYLLLHPDGRTREQIGLAFWPEISTAQVKNNFHVTLHHLRKALGGSDWIRFDRGRYRVAFEAGIVFDAATFEERVVAALRALRARPDDREAAEALDAALPAYRGHLLDDESVGDWHLEMRDRLARLHEEALLALGAAHTRAARHAEAAELFRRMVTLDPLHEDAVHHLMLALARDHRRSDALRAFDQLAVALRRELDAEPAAEVQALATQLRAGVAV
jgi:predicted ATPase/DNA-binding SARP family transcriptional activator